MRGHLLLQPIEGHVEPVVDDVPPAELDPSELRVVELVPIHVGVGIVLLRPAKERDVVLDRMLSDPVREVVVRQAGLALRAPELVVHEKTPRWSYIQSCAPPLIVCLGSYLK